MFAVLPALAFGGALALTGLPAATASAQIRGEAVTYEIGGERFEGYVARNAALGDDQPVVVILHDWDGLTDYERRRAGMLAELGYAAVALDLYGEGVRPTELAEKRARSGALYEDRERMRSLMTGGIQALVGAGMDAERMVVMGYCFGGAAVLELARSGAAAEGYVAFHGGLGTPEGQDYAGVVAPLLILHGTADAAAPMSQVADLASRLDAAGKDYTMELYGGVDHAFTVWGGERYDGAAELASWQAFMDFLAARL
jgi:dienelactone hydrolase